MRNAFRAIALLVLLGATPVAGLDAVYVVRHAQKSAEPGWSEHGRLRPLTEKGAQCSVRLGERLGDAGVAAVYSSETSRTLTTGVAISGKIAASITGDDVTVRAPAAFAERARRSHAGERAILVVGHSNTVGALIAAFRPDAAACFDKIGLRDDGSVDESRYGDVWRVDLDGDACAGGIVHSDLGQADGLDCTTP